MKFKSLYFPIAVLLLAKSASAVDQNTAAKVPVIKDIKSYCLDLNWEKQGVFAKPGLWNEADPVATVAWHKSIGSNVIQTFCVSTNGYAWYKNGVVPEQPGLKHDFLREVVKLGHAEGMMVMGYFCIASNTRWGTENPDLSYGTPNTYHIPYTDEYLKFLAASITDAVSTTGIDGFMIDWVWQPNRKATGEKWIAAEKKLYAQLMGEPFPTNEKLTEEQYLIYSRKAIDRCWKTIHKAAKDANPKCIIWLTSNKMHHPHVNDSDMYKQVDWLMSEAGSLTEIEKVKPMVSKDAHLITCMALWNGQDATTAVPQALAAGVGLYGFAKPDSKNATINLNRILPMQITELTGDAKSISVLARAYQGKSIDSVWNGNGFTEAGPPPFRIEFKRRQGWQDTAKITHESDRSVIKIHNMYQSGRGSIKRVGDQWPSSIHIQLVAKSADKPGPSHFRIANGKIGASIRRLAETKIVAGEMQGGLDIQKPWQAQGFLNDDKPDSPVLIGPVEATLTPEWAEFVIPAKLLEGNPEILVFEWCNGEKVR